MLGERWSRGVPPWDLRASIRKVLRTAESFLDLGTGGGEFLSSLVPLPHRAFATEGYPPNIPLARARLAPFGVKVLPIDGSQHIDLPSKSMDVVLARHEGFDAREVARVLKPHGWFLTEQVAAGNYAELLRQFGVPSEPPHNHLSSVADFAKELSGSGLDVREFREARYSDSFSDVGAVVYFLRAAPWEVPGFDVERFRGVLERIDSDIRRIGRLEVTAIRYWVLATAPG